MPFKFLLLVTFLSAVFHSTIGAFHVKQCYQCEYFDFHASNKTNNEKCKENPPPKDLIVNCTNEHPGVEDFQCVKVTGRIEVDEENFNYVKRACSPGRNYDTCKDCKDTKAYETQYGFVKRGKHCVCDDNDNCNSSSGLNISMVTLAFGFFAVGILKF